ncbi:bacteriocin immunity protein, partial [Pseudomonas sp. CrR25]|nr:bacteriocin immunity protein [Pseudomonas sp. CrR25]
FYPAAGVDDSPEGVLSEVKKWREANGLPGFKTSF